MNNLQPSIDQKALSESPYADLHRANPNKTLLIIDNVLPDFNDRERNELHQRIPGYQNMRLLPSQKFANRQVILAELSSSADLRYLLSKTSTSKNMEYRTFNGRAIHPCTIALADQNLQLLNNAQIRLTKNQLLEIYDQNNHNTHNNLVLHPSGSPLGKTMWNCKFELAPSMITPKDLKPREDDPRIMHWENYNIPNDILIYIFNFLPSGELLLTRQVCTTWRDNALYVQQFNLSPWGKYSIAARQQVNQFAQNLEALTLRKTDPQTQEVISFTSIAHLSLAFCERLTDDMLQKILKALGRTLRSLDVTFCHNITSASFDNIKRMAPSITTLNISANSLSDGLEHVLPMLDILISRTNKRINDEALFKIITLGQKLTALDLYGCPVTEDGITNLSYMANLQVLNLEKTIGGNAVYQDEVINKHPSDIRIQLLTKGRKLKIESLHQDGVLGFLHQKNPNTLIVLCNKSLDKNFDRHRLPKNTQYGFTHQQEMVEKYDRRRTRFDMLENQVVNAANMPAAVVNVLRGEIQQWKSEAQTWFTEPTSAKQAIQHYTIAMILSASNGNLLQATLALRAAQEIYPTPKMKLYTYMLDTCCKTAFSKTNNQWVIIARYILHKMTRCGLRLNSITYNRLIKACILSAQHATAGDKTKSTKLMKTLLNHNPSIPMISKNIANDNSDSSCSACIYNIPPNTSTAQIVETLYYQYGISVPKSNIIIGGPLSAQSPDC